MFNISITDNEIFEANESFYLAFNSSSLPSRVLSQPDCVLMITIVDNDGEIEHTYVKVQITYRSMHI